MDRDADAGASARVEGGDRRARRPRVLVVDDEKAIANALRRLLSAYDVEIVTDSPAAARRLEEAPGFDVILCDLTMPELPGPELHRRTIERRPELRDRFIFMTGGAFAAETAAFLDSCGCRVLEKPFDLERLQRYVEEVAREAVRA